ncbi:MAG TPA: hypothetical protein VF590_16050 [Isosphaeraceae bacterium]|jgi:hypothetical protein
MTGATLLLRQIHPNFVQDGFASSVAFRPNEADNGLMSTCDGDLIAAEASWTHYTTVSKKQSAGVTAVAVDECTAEGLPAGPDPEPFPEHAVVDFTGVPEKHWRSKSKKLQAKARARGWLYQVSTES